MDIKIVPMMQDDVPQVAALEAACFSDPWSAQILSNELQNELSLWLVAKDGDTVLGYVGSQSVLDEADMMNLAVRETVRRQGIARLLVLSLCRQLHEKGVMSLTLEVRDSNEPAIRLYSSLGFLQVGRRPNYYFHPKEDANADSNDTAGPKIPWEGIREEYDNPEDLWEDNPGDYDDEDEAWDEWYDEGDEPYDD